MNNKKSKKQSLLTAQQTKFIANVASVDFSIYHLFQHLLAEYHLGDVFDGDYMCKIEFNEKMPTNNDMLRTRMKWFYEENVRPKYYQAKRELFKLLDEHKKYPHSDFNVNSWFDSCESYAEYVDFVIDYCIDKYRDKFGYEFIPELDKYK